MRWAVVIAACIVTGCSPEIPTRDTPEPYAPAPRQIQTPTGAISEDLLAQWAGHHGKTLDEAKAEIEASFVTEEHRRSSPDLNWIHIGITTGKFSESMSGGVHRTYEECMTASFSEDNVCIPINALPDSYWNTSAQPQGPSDD